MSWDGYLDAHTWVLVDGTWWHVAPAADGDAPAGPGSTVVGHVITAHNPGGAWRSAADNAGAHAALVAACRADATVTHPAWGGDPAGRWMELGLLVVGLDDEAARALGARFGQDAIYALAPGRRILLACDGTVARTQAVRAEAGPPPVP